MLFYLGQDSSYPRYQRTLYGAKGAERQLEALIYGTSTHFITRL